MATLRIQVPEAEHVGGVVEYAGDITVHVDEASQMLYVQQGTLILAEFPQDRYESWELIDDAPALDDDAPVTEHGA